MSSSPLDQKTLRLSHHKDDDKIVYRLGQEAEQRRNTESHGNRPASCANSVFSTGRGSRLRRAGLAGGMNASTDGRIADGRRTLRGRQRTVACAGGGGSGLERLGQRGRTN
jgi:hypothetical protein